MPILIQHSPSFSEWILDAEETLHCVPRLKSEVEVLVISYNSEPWIADCLTSILKQDFRLQLGIVVHDDGSADNTVLIARELLLESHHACTLIRRKSNTLSITGGKFYRELISSTKSRFVAILDADDFWISKNKLRLQYEFMTEREDLAISFHDYFVVDSESETTVLVHPSAFWQGYSGTSFVLGLENFIGTSTVMLRSQFLMQIDWQGYDTLAIGDFPIWIRTSLGKCIAYCPDLKTFYRLRSSSLSSRSKLVEDMLRATPAIKWAGKQYEQKAFVNILWRVSTWLPLRLLTAFVSKLTRRSLSKRRLSEIIDES
jgi:glycosyltransferase involved in cell wall biosynthesis